jgi:uroporphyrinogen-III synthase
VIVTRPAEASAALAQDLAALGIEAMAAPMLTVETLPIDPTAPSHLRALLVTSGNGAAAAAGLAVRRDIPVFAVGDATAAAARRSGFEAVDTASGDAETLAALVTARCRPEDGPLLWIGGEAVATNIARLLRDRGYSVDRRIAYRTVLADDLPAEVVGALDSGAVDAILFFSPRTAEGFARVARRLGLEKACARVAAHCMSPAVARAASTLRWRALHVAETPTKAALIATLSAGRHASEPGGEPGHS